MYGDSPVNSNKHIQIACQIMLWRSLNSPYWSLTRSTFRIFLFFPTLSGEVILSPYMIFVILLHRQDFWVNFCSTQKCVKCDKINVASKQRKSQDNNVNLSCGAILSCGAMPSYSALLMWSNLSLIHMTKLLQMTRNFSCGAKNLTYEAILLHMNFFAPQTMSGIYDNYHVWLQLIWIIS